MRDRHLFGRYDVTSRQLPDKRLHFCGSVWGRRCGRIKKEEKLRLVKKNKCREKTVQSRFKKILKDRVNYLGPALESRLEHGRLDCGTYVLTFGYIFGTNVIDYLCLDFEQCEIELFARSFSFVHMSIIPDGPGA